jgi:hypothetical protein
MEKSGLIFLSTVLAWFAAVKTGRYVDSMINQMVHEIAPADTLFVRINYTNAVCGVLGGLVGSSIVALSFAVMCKEFRAIQNWASIVIPGTALGFLLECAGSDNKILLHKGSLLPLFVAWQMCLAGVIAYRIVPRANADEVLEAFNRGLLGNSGIRRAESSRLSEEIPAGHKPKLDKQAIKKALRPNTEEFEV